MTVIVAPPPPSPAGRVIASVAVPSRTAASAVAASGTIVAVPPSSSSAFVMTPAAAMPGAPASLTMTASTGGVCPSRRMNVTSPVTRIGAMNNRASDGRSRRISWTTRRKSARTRRPLTG